MDATVHLISESVDAMGEKGPHMPPSPRLILRSEYGWRIDSGLRRRGKPVLVKKITVLPLVNEDWEVVKDKWVLPGCRVLTYVQVCALALANGWAVQVVN